VNGSSRTFCDLAQRSPFMRCSQYRRWSSLCWRSPDSGLEKTLPDVRLAWRDVLTGAIITALLFNLGKFLFGQYLVRINLASTYGAASSLVIALLWIYYSAQVLLFGAKFTQVYSDINHTHVEPVPGAEAVTVEKIVSHHRPNA
jgi:membrane protein